ncbi:hypothetical protein [Cupriavidus necator]
MPTLPDLEHRVAQSLTTLVALLDDVLALLTALQERVGVPAHDPRGQVLREGLGVCAAEAGCRKKRRFQGSSTPYLPRKNRSYAILRGRFFGAHLWSFYRADS